MAAPKVDLSKEVKLLSTKSLIIRLNKTYGFYEV